MKINLKSLHLFSYLAHGVRWMGGVCTGMKEDGYTLSRFHSHAFLTVTATLLLSAWILTTKALNLTYYFSRDNFTEMGGEGGRDPSRDLFVSLTFFVHPSSTLNSCVKGERVYIIYDWGEDPYLKDIFLWILIKLLLCTCSVSQMRKILSRVLILLSNNKDAAHQSQRRTIVRAWKKKQRSYALSFKMMSEPVISVFFSFSPI